MAVAGLADANATFASWSSAGRDDGLEVLAGDDERAPSAAVHSVQQLKDVRLQCSLRIGIEGRKGTVRRAVVGLEDGEEVIGGLVPEIENLAGASDMMPGEEFGEPRLRAPKRRRFDAHR